MRRVYDVLRHLKKKVGAQAFSEEYKVVMKDLKESLGIGKKKNSKGQMEDEDQLEVNIQENAEAGSNYEEEWNSTDWKGK